MRLNLDKHLTIKISNKSFAQRFDVAMTSFSSDNNKLQSNVRMRGEVYAFTFV